jgi:hypothetical protein
LLATLGALWVGRDPATDGYFAMISKLPDALWRFGDLDGTQAGCGKQRDGKTQREMNDNGPWIDAHHRLGVGPPTPMQQQANECQNNANPSEWERPTRLDANEIRHNDANHPGDCESDQIHKNIGIRWSGTGTCCQHGSCIYTVFVKKRLW